MHSENSRNRKLRFMELMQRCLPFKWQKYWNCGTKEFDLLMILQDIDNLKLSVQDRLLHPPGPNMDREGRLLRGYKRGSPSFGYRAA